MLANGHWQCVLNAVLLAFYTQMTNHMASAPLLFGRQRRRNEKPCIAQVKAPSLYSPKPACI